MISCQNIGIIKSQIDYLQTNKYTNTVKLKEFISSKKSNYCISKFRNKC